MEEYEAAVRQVPEWKINWVKQIIENDQVIGKKDHTLDKTKCED